MEHVCSSRKNECLFIDPNMENFHEILNSNHEDQESDPLFSGFPSPFFDDISTAPLLTKNPTHQHKPCLNIDTEPLPSEPKRLKKRSVGKKDRHSKIHTAQGLRDRRMRLSLQIARKFFDLQDLLGFDKASNTIEWLFSKSNKAIKEVAQNFDPQLLANQSTSHEEESCQVLLGLTKSCISKPENYSKKEIKNDKDLKKQIPNNNSSSVSSRQTRDQKRAKARDRTRERLMIKQLEKSKPQLFLPKDEIYKLGLRCPNHHNVEELGFMTSSPSESILQDSSSDPSLEYSRTDPNFLRELQSSTVDVNSFENYSGSIVGTSTYSPAGWLNSSNGGLLGMPGEWEAAADRFISEYYYNYEITPTTATPLTGDIYNEQNPSSFFMSSTTTNILNF